MAGVSWKVMEQRLQSVNLIEEAKPIIEATGYKIVAEVKEQLYETGTDRYGKKLRNYKSSRYAKKKHEMNPKPGFKTPDLRLNGSMYQGLQVETDWSGYRVYSNVSYFKYLEDKAESKYAYGSKAFEMNRENKRDYRKKVLFPALRKVIKQRTKTR